jgi:hypothetical protein
MKELLAITRMTAALMFAIKQPLLMRGRKMELESATNSHFNH